MDWSFQQCWNDGLIPVERKQVPRDYCYASELGGAYIDRFLKMKGIEYTTPPNERSLRKFQAGNFWEWLVSMVLKRSGLIIEQQTRLEYKYDNLLPVAGKVDFLAGGTPDWAKARAEMDVYDLPDFVKRVTEKIISTFDENGAVEYKKMVLEIKSASSFVFKGLERTDAPLKNHVLQAFHYIKCLNLDEAHIVYIDKDSCLIKEFGVHNPSPTEDYYKEDIRVMSGYYYANERPPLEQLIGWENGKFTVNKKVEYSNYLEMLYGFETPEQYRSSVSSKVTSANRVVKRIIDGAKMTDKNKEAIDGIKRYYPNFDELVDEAKVLASKGMLVEEETEE